MLSIFIHHASIFHPHLMRPQVRLHLDAAGQDVLLHWLPDGPAAGAGGGGGGGVGGGDAAGGSGGDVVW